MRSRTRLGAGMILLVLSLAGHRAPAASLTVVSRTAAAGGTVTVPITYAAEDSQIVALTVTVGFPTAQLAFVSAAASSGKQVQTSAGSGSVSLLVFTQAGNVVFADGELATITFSMPSTASGAATISLTGGLGQPASGVGGAITVRGVSGTVTVGPACSAPEVPLLAALPTSVPSGRALSVSWAQPASPTPARSYVLETSGDAFKTVGATLTSRTTSALVQIDPSPTDATLSLRVRSVSDCGAESATSGVKSVVVQRSLATFVSTRTDLSLTSTVGGAAPRGSYTLRNVGAISGNVDSSDVPNLLSVSPRSLALAPNEEGTFTVLATSQAMADPGYTEGLLVYSSAAEPRSSVRFSLTVTPAGARRATLKASQPTIVFSAPAGGNPDPKALTVNVAPGSDVAPGSVILVPKVGPGGAWLSLGQGGSALVAGQPITLTVDRSKRLFSEGVAPLRTLVLFLPAGGNAADAAVVEVIDNETVAVSAGAGRDAAGRRGLAVGPPGGSSFIVPTAVNAAGIGGRFTSDGWLRNLSGSPVSADVYYTPEGKDGLRDPSVLKASVTIPPTTTLRLSDVVSNVYGTVGSGQVEVRSPGPFDLTLRTRVDSIVGGDPATRYSTEIPTVSYGSGAVLNGAPLVLPGIDDDASNRANLILAETSGAPADVRVTICDGAGQVVGTYDASLPPFGKVQRDRIVNSVAEGTSVSGGWASVAVTTGSGRVAPVATVIDNRSGSFSAVGGRAVTGPSGREAFAGPVTFVIPAAVRTTGANNTQFTTGLSIVNGTAGTANLTLRYNYVDQDDGNERKSVSKPLSVPGRSTLPKSLGADVIRTLLGVTNRSYGYFVLEGDVGRVVAVGSILAQVDPNDPGKGYRFAQVNGTYKEEPVVIRQGDAPTHFAGAEKTDQKRTNLVLIELDGKPVDVQISMYGATGQLLAQKTVHVAAGEYFQINDVFGDQGVALGDGPFQNVEVSAHVVSGDGRILAVATVNDNISRNPEVFILQPSGPPGDSTITF